MLMTFVCIGIFSCASLLRDIVLSSRSFFLLRLPAVIFLLDKAQDENKLFFNRSIAWTAYKEVALCTSIHRTAL